MIAAYNHIIYLTYTDYFFGYKPNLFVAPQTVFLDGALSLYEGDKFNLTCMFTERNPTPSIGPYIFRVDEEIIVLNVSDRISITKNLIRDA